MARGVTSSNGYWLKSSAASPPAITAETISCWIYIPTTLPSATWTAIGHSTPVPANSYLGLGCVVAGTSRISAFSSNGSQATTTVAVNLATATWYHACVTFGGGNQIVYLNGGNATSGAYNAPGSSLTSITVGALAINNAVTSGPDQNVIIAEVGIWAATLTASEVLALSYATRPFRVRPASLYAYWPLFGFLSPETDLSPGQQPLTLTGTSAGFAGPGMESMATRRVFAPFDPATTTTTTSTTTTPAPTTTTTTTSSTSTTTTSSATTTAGPRDWTTACCQGSVGGVAQ